MAETGLVEVQAQDIMPGFGSQQSWELTQRVAGALSKSTLVPKEFQGNLPNCIIALNMACRMGADPLMVMQNLFVVQGRPGWSAQFLIGLFNTCGRFSPMRYEWVGRPADDTWGCRAWAIEKATGDKLEGSTVTIALAKKEGWYGKNGSKWQTMPEQMLRYRAAAWMIRVFAPELAMGMHTAEEVEDFEDEDLQTAETRVEREVDRNANRTPIDIEPATPEQGQPKEDPPAEGNGQPAADGGDGEPDPGF